MKYAIGPTKLTAITAAHVFFEPFTSSLGRRARSAHADTASEIWSEVASMSITFLGTDNSSQRRDRFTMTIMIWRPMCPRSGEGRRTLDSHTYRPLAPCAVLVNNSTPQR